MYIGLLIFRGRGSWGAPPLCINPCMYMYIYNVCTVTHSPTILTNYEHSELLEDTSFMPFEL